VSVIVLTRNEQVNIGPCLRELTAFSDDVVVLDSYSTDETVQIVQEQFPTVRLCQRAFDTEYKQRNYGLHEIPYRHEWVYICDADERVPAELVEEIGRVVAEAPESNAAYRLRFRNIYLGRWIRHSSGYPVWVMRLVRAKRVSYEVRATNVHPVVDGAVGQLDGHFIHYSFNAGLVRWLEKHNFYSTCEAEEGVKLRRAGVDSRALLSADPMRRRRAAKNLSYFLRGRAVWRFFYSYVLRGGWMDGWAGLQYCMMLATYEYWTELKVREIEHPWDEATQQLVRRLLSEEGR
jgi:glycosyltransferase involved in cell wall biosynthesis